MALVLTGFLAITRAVSHAEGGTWDEAIYLLLGREAVLHHDLDAFVGLGVAPLPVLIEWSRSALEPAEAPAYDATVYKARLTRARINAAWWFGVPLILTVFLWLTVVHGWEAGVVAAALVAASPNIIAHASLATTDVPFAATFVLAIAALRAYLKVQSWPRGAMVAVALGLALATKYSAVSLFLISGILLAWHARTRKSRADLLVLAGGLVVGWAGHGFALAPLATETGLATQWVERLFAWTGHAARLSHWLIEIRAPIYIRGLAAQLFLEREGQEAFLLGRTSQFGWWYYFPTALAMKSTPVELVAFAAFGILAWVRRGKDIDTQVLTVSVIVFGGLAMLGQRNLGIRYVLPVVVVVLMAAVIWVGDRLGRSRTALAVGIAAVLGQVASLASVAPQALAYFNDLSGGPAQGYTRLVDSNLDWGQDLPRLGAWLNAQGTDRVGLAYFGSAPIAAYGVTPVGLRLLSSLPESSRPRWIAISATYLQGVFLCDDPLKPFRALEPSSRVGYSILVYGLDRDEVRRALAEAVSNPCTP